LLLLLAIVAYLAVVADVVVAYVDATASTKAPTNAYDACVA
jgi:hypothetical protein